MTTEEKFQKLISVIEESGQLAREHFYTKEGFTEKDDRSPVTEIDVKIEKILRAFVSEHFPNDTIVGEEGEDVIGDSGYVWYLDPIDGTGNFIRKIPLFGITATRLGESAEDSFAVVHNPISKQTFSSYMEDGAYENENVCLPTADEIGGRLMINILSAGVESWVYPAKYSLIKELGLRYGKCGSFSAGLLELAYVASGRLDAVLSLLNNPWDTAAGLYLNKAAGSDISIFENGTWKKYEGAIKELYGPDFRGRKIYLVSHPHIHSELCELISDPKQWASK